MSSSKIKYLLLIAVLLFAFPLRANDETKTRIAILYSGYTAKLNEGYIPKVDDQITLWEIFLMQNKISYSVIHDKDLERGISDDFDLLILPSVYSISEKEFNSLKSFLNDGNSILNVGSKLSYDSDQNYKGLNFLNELLGVDLSEFTDKGQSLFQYPNQDLIFVDKNLKSSVLQISTKYPPIICNTESTFFNHVGYLETASESSSQTLLIYGKSGNGKFVNIGFNFDDVIGGENEQDIFKSIIINAIKWLDKIPAAYIKNFPNDFINASIVVIENNFGLKPGLIDNLSDNGIDPYILFTPEQKLDEVIKEKIKDEHFIIDLRNLFADSSENDWNQLNGIFDKVNEANKKIFNVLLSEKMLENKNLISFLDVNGVKVFLLNQNNSGLPEINNGKKILIPYFENNYNKTFENSINFFTYKSKINCEEKVDDKFVDDVLKSKSYKNWFCTFNQLKDWYELKNNITVSISDIVENNLSLTISNNNSDKVDDISFLINLPSKVNTKLLEVKSGNDQIEYSVDGLNQLNLRIDELGPRQLKKINISFNIN